MKKDDYPTGSELVERWGIRPFGLLELVVGGRLKPLSPLDGAEIERPDVFELKTNRRDLWLSRADNLRKRGELVKLSPGLIRAVREIQNDSFIEGQQVWEKAWELDNQQDALLKGITRLSRKIRQLGGWTNFRVDPALSERTVTLLLKAVYWIDEVRMVDSEFIHNNDMAASRMSVEDIGREVKAEAQALYEAIKRDLHDKRQGVTTASQQEIYEALEDVLP